MLTRTAGPIAQQFTSESDLLSQSLNKDTISFVLENGEFRVYSITNFNPGDGFLLPNGNFATNIQIGSPNMKMVSATSSRTIASGSSGTIEAITPTAEQKVRITLLVSTGTTAEGDISILSGTDTIVDSVVINGNDTPQSIDLNNRLSVGGQGPNHQYIEGALGEVVTIVKDTGSTSNTLFVAHEIWERE